MPIRIALRHGPSGTAFDYAICTYGRSSELGACINILLEAGGTAKHNVPAVLDLLRGRIDRLAGQLDADPELLKRRFPELDFGVTGTRLLTLRGATLLHVATEYGNVEATKMLWIVVRRSMCGNPVSAGPCYPCIEGWGKRTTCGIKNR